MNKYKKLMGNTAIFGIGQMVAKVMGFLLVALYTNFMTEDQVSEADLVYKTINVLVPFVTLSMADAVIRFGMDKGYDPRKVFTGANSALMLGMTVFAVLTPLFVHNEDIGQYTFLLYICCYFSCFRQITSQFVRARGYVKLFMLDGIGTVFTQIIANVVFIIAMKLGPTGYILSIIVSDVCSLIFLYVVAGLTKYVDTKYYDKQVLGEMLKFSAPLIPTYVLWWVTSSSDSWFVVRMVSKAANGIYSVSYRIPNLLLLLSTMFYQAWQMSAIEERNSKELGKFYENVFKAYSSILFIGAAGLILFVRVFTGMLTPPPESGKEFYLAYLYTPILVISMVFQCFCQFLSSVYTTKKKSMNSLWTALVAAVTNFILNFLLIPRIGVYGAAIATAASYFACYVVRMIDVRKLVFFKVSHQRLFWNSLLLIIMSIIAIKEPKLCYLWQSLLFILVLLYNFNALYGTIKRILPKTASKQNLGNKIVKR
ncbi:MAG: polysaccharide biosynthesis C-terminal domain-containing protein [Oscillospiraceae bacterium]|nr:polysaccharide biosynthesis C-terminal domain-containing protein [Oscillospiraceae bacterium]MCR5807142.1 polysaccharide biosynthesis C-terminal domain-containing protein [Oscillospiraceae bacterium]